ncbi:flagellar export protein FliJ [Methylosinus sp. Sm6]|uniref:flagellar export protein FliJ n=1 Tax=Methylosinus sp. Sm6 TaxID=2866948 RepID=UPI001C994BD0|nr:flagellar export protein FliJ [Methylosinus sp. Sm6]MBY6242982.1 flagellar export protein FliJ [Methylosinus sp. Sm6]
MKSRDALVRLKRFQAEECRRRVAQLQTMIAEFSRMTGDLDREIAHEEQRANIADPNHFAYPTYARAARARRDNLLRSVGDLRSQLAEAESHLKDASDELSKAQSQEARNRMLDIMPDRHGPDRREAARRV